MQLDKQTFYRMDASGNIREWSISAEDDTIYIEHGIHGGTMTGVEELVPRGKGGRSLDDQVMSRVASRISKQRDRGYTTNIDLAKLKPVNSLGLPQPMLAQRIEKRKDIDWRDAFTQRKYDGNRCLITRIDDDIIAYTRNGKVVESIDHITSLIDIPDGMIVDGELYAHGVKLQTIRSWISRKQEDSKKLSYHAYDVISDKPFSERFKMLENFGDGNIVQVAPTHHVASEEQLNTYYQIFVEDGYEGAMLRWGNAGYESSKRSKYVLKKKQVFDSEATVIGMSLSERGVPVLKLRWHNGAEFEATAPGSHEEREQCYKHMHQYLGQKVTIEYRGITKENKPFHAIATRWRFD